jgi:hypothetical protein
MRAGWSSENNQPMIGIALLYDFGAKASDVIGYMIIGPFHFARKDPTIPKVEEEETPL